MYSESHMLFLSDYYCDRLQNTCIIVLYIYHNFVISMLLLMIVSYILYTLVFLFHTIMPAYIPFIFTLIVDMRYGSYLDVMFKFQIRFAQYLTLG